MRLLVLILPLLLITGACTEPDLDTSAEPDALAGSEADTSGEVAAQRVDVTLREYDVELDGPVASGDVIFSATNRGEVEHSLAIEGQDVHQTLPSSFEAGTTMDLTVRLEPGEYRLYCPVEDHAEQGMETVISVR